ncbi:hypothetical protein BASA81_006180 [Batrachochytrium salamandrivorans]|nr:hypothetical protein BASA81_006180 [Batrachochytrium salamandrivorans]
MLRLLRSRQIVRTFATGKLPKGTTIKSDPSQYTTIDFSSKSAFPTSSAPRGLAQKTLLSTPSTTASEDAPQKQSKFQETTATSSKPPPLLRLNEDITGVLEARLINGETGETISVSMSFQDCLAEAMKLEMDLIEVSKTPPVLKIANFSKILEQRKEQRKKTQAFMGFKPVETAGLEEVKEVHMGTNIENHDFEVKRELMKKFLLKRHPIKLVIKFKRSAHLKLDERPAKARQLVERIKSDLRECIAPEVTKQHPKDHQGTLTKVFFPLLPGNKPVSPPSQ